MQRVPIVPSHVVLKLLTLAITIVVGFQLGPTLSARRTSAPAIGCAEQKVAEHAVKVGQRLEPRGFPAQFLQRLPLLRPCDRPGAISGAREALALAASASDGRSAGERLPIVKHVPRMERGDPPRT